MAAIGIGNTTGFLSEEQVEGVVAQGLDSLNLAGKRVLVIIPDSTRTMPLPMFFRQITSNLMGKAAQLDFLIALGTHPAMSEEAILRLVGISAEEKAGKYAAVNIFNHAWKDPQTLVQLGADSERRGGGTQRRAAEHARAGASQPPHPRLRSDHHLRAGLPARGGRFLGRQQVLLPRHRRLRHHRLSPTGWAR
jgi:hypothetical protein